jgi:Domain of unknown function (DUF4062)
MTSVDRRPALFVSSTALDLQPFREVVIHVCQRLGIDLLAMEEFGLTRERPPRSARRRSSARTSSSACTRIATVTRPKASAA